jgi:hypothetical protein
VSPPRRGGSSADTQIQGGVGILFLSKVVANRLLLIHLMYVMQASSIFLAMAL